VTGDRDPLVRTALDAGLSKEEVHVLTGLGRNTIDRIIAKKGAGDATSDQ
jgi:predicted DNA-binding transcriptional regulator AlpA